LPLLGWITAVKGCLFPVPLQCSCHPAARANSTNPNNRRMRSAGMSRVQYQSPLRDRRSHERGTSTSRVMTASMRAPCRQATCIAAHDDFPSVANQTAFNRPCDFEHSSPCRWILGRLRIGVACLRSMPAPFLKRRAGVGVPGAKGGGLQLAELLEREQSHDVFAGGRLAILVGVPAVVLETLATALAV